MFRSCLGRRLFTAEEDVGAVSFDVHLKTAVKVCRGHCKVKVTVLKLGSSPIPDLDLFEITLTYKVISEIVKVLEAL